MFIANFVIYWLFYVFIQLLTLTLPNNEIVKVKLLNHMVWTDCENKNLKEVMQAWSLYYLHADWWCWYSFVVYHLLSSVTLNTEEFLLLALSMKPPQSLIWIMFRFLWSIWVLRQKVTALVHERTKQGLLYPVKDQSLLQVQVHKDIPVLNLTFWVCFFYTVKYHIYQCINSLSPKKLDQLENNPFSAFLAQGKGMPGPKIFKQGNRRR